MSWSDNLFVIPYSTLLIFIVNVVTVIVSSYIYRLIIDVDRLEAQELEVRSYNRSLKEARSRDDREAQRRLKRQGVRIKKLSAISSGKRRRAFFVTFLPFTVVSFFLGFIYVGIEVVRFPFEFILFSGGNSFAVWYFLTYLTAFLPLSRIFKTSLSYGQGFGTGQR